MRERHALFRQGLPTVRQVAATGVAVIWAVSSFHPVPVVDADGRIRQHPLPTAVKSSNSSKSPPGKSPPGKKHRQGVGHPQVISTELFVARQTLNQVLYRDRQQRRTLERAVGQLHDRHIVEALKLLQHLLDQPEDVFAWFGSRRRPSSVRQEVLKLFRKLDAATLQNYEELYGPEARRLLRSGLSADASGNHHSSNHYSTKDREVARRFFYTQAGFQAVDRLAARWFDRGRYARAARAWSRLLDEPAHKRRLSKMLLIKATLAHHLCGHSVKSETLLKQLGDERLRIAGRLVSLRQWILDQTVSSDTVASSSIHSASVRRHFPAVTAPHLKPLWTLSFRRGAEDGIGALIDRWEDQQANLFEPSAVVRSAIVVGGRVVVRDFSGIRAFELKTGTPCWTYRCRTSLAKTFDEIKKQYGHVSIQTNGGARLNFQQQYAGNGTRGLLSGDNQRVYAIDAVTVISATAPEQRTRGSLLASIDRPATTNRLIALRVGGSSSRSSERERLAWWIGGARDERIPSRPLAGHFFLGPPLPADGRLFAVTESGRQLNLVALNAETGTLLWKQGLGFVERSVEQDVQRSGLFCAPLFAEGVLVCPTQLGVLVGVDAVTGTLRWAYRYGENVDRRRAGGWSRLGTISHGYTGFAVRPQIVAGRVLLLPRHSSRIHCVDLFTGRPIWSRSRDDAEYIGTVRQGVVLVIGRRSRVGLSLATGTERWKSPSAMPSGRGIVAGDRYLLPLESGRIQAIDPVTGREVGLAVRTVQTARTIDAASKTNTKTNTDKRIADQTNTKTNTDKRSSTNTASSLSKNVRAERVWKPGNLVAGREVIISTGARGLTVFPQAGPLLSRVRRRLNRSPNATSDHLLAAELELALGRLDASKSLLRGVLKSASSGDSFLRAEQLMRTVLYYELDRGVGLETAHLASLNRFSHTPADRGRYLMRRVKSELREGRLDGVLKAARELSALRLKNPLPFDGDDGHLVSPSSWVRSMVGRARTRCVRSPVVLASARVPRRPPPILTSDRVPMLERYLDLYSRWPGADKVRNRLARQLIDEGHFQRAELLLLQNRRSRNHHAAAVATRELAVLWDRLGFSYEAAGLLTELKMNSTKSFAATKSFTTKRETAEEFLVRFPNDGSTSQIYRWMNESRRPVSRVNISQELWSGAAVDLKQPYEKYRRKLVTPAESMFDLLDKGAKRGGLLAVIDRHSGLIRHEIELPAVYWYPAVVSGSRVGHFLPLGGKASMYGLSFLNRTRTQPLWRAAPHRRKRIDEPLRVGPAGPSFCLFQSRRHLIAVDPATGRILWQRSGLDPYGGLLSDPQTGLCGDDKVVVFFGSDRKTYTVYRTATGEKLSHGRMKSETMQPRHAFGRRLCYVYRPPDDKAPRIRIWDPLGNRIVFDRPAFETLSGNTMFRKLEGGCLPTAGGCHELIAVLAEKTLCAIDVATATIRWIVPLNASDMAGLNTMRVCRDRDYYYINLQRAVPVDGSPRYSYTVNNTFLPVMSVRTDLHVVDALTGRRLWKRRFPDCSLVRTPYLRLPFLIILSRLRDRGNTSLQSLNIELVDSRTGRTIGSRANLFPDGILRLDYKPRRSRLELYGRRTRIDIDFGKRKAESRKSKGQKGRG